jgi:hypothetical protein
MPNHATVRAELQVAGVDFLSVDYLVGLRKFLLEHPKK